ncbi:MAG: SCO family protein, partial [Balneolaceae bacterium]
ETYQFPDDFRGSTLLVGFIYTHCPDICTFITANLRNIHQELEDPEGIRFLIVTFDPERDTPEVLESYAEAFDMNRPPFHFLTGETAEIEAMMERMTVRSQVSYTRETENGDELYFLNHSDKMLLINPHGELIMEYGGSMTPPHIVIEDLNNL